MEQLVFLLLIGAASLAKWLMEKSAEKREQAKRDAEESAEVFRPAAPASPWHAPRPVASPPAPRPAGNSRNEEAARRLREALGLPPEASETTFDTPAEPTRRPMILEERVLLPEEIEEEPEPEFVPPVFVAPPLPTFVPLPTPAPAMAARAANDVPEPARTALDDLLRSRDGLRKAILAQEILGTPKGLVF